VPRKRKILTAKRAFSLWALAVFVFLYLPIAVMVLFAFNKPSPAALADFHGSNVCDIPPSQLGNLTVWNGFTTCWFKVGLHDPTSIPAIGPSAQLAAAAAIVATILG
jgi:ABC-type spermidine/putrescine transport system permease subunit II